MMITKIHKVIPPTIIDKTTILIMEIRATAGKTIKILAVVAGGRVVGATSSAVQVVGDNSSGSLHHGSSDTLGTFFVSISFL